MKNIILALMFGCVAHAAPIPGTATSKLVSPQIGLYHSPLGFQMNSAHTGWEHVAPPSGNKFVATVYRSAPVSGDRAEPGSVASQIHADLHRGGDVVGASKMVSTKGVPATLTVRVDHLDRDTTLDRYIAKWMKEYPRYGFDVLGSKPFMQSKNKGYVLDLVNRTQGKQLRQVVFLKQKDAVILTCRDNVSTFQTSLRACNDIIKTFTW